MKPSLRWPIGITTLLVVFAAANIEMMRIASDDPSFAVEPNYYQKAVAFDSTMAQERRNVALGWVATTSLANRTIAVTLRDSVGAPVTGAKLRVDARFNARANDVLQAALVERAPGRYEGSIAASRSGEWEVRVEATRNAERFTARTRTTAHVAP